MELDFFFASKPKVLVQSRDFFPKKMFLGQGCRRAAAGQDRPRPRPEGQEERQEGGGRDRQEINANLITPICRYFNSPTGGFSLESSFFYHLIVRAFCELRTFIC